MIAASDCDGPLSQDRVGDFFAWVIQTYGYAWNFMQYALTGDWNLAAPRFTSTQLTRLYLQYRAESANCADRPVPGAKEAFLALPNWRWHLATTRCVSMAGDTTAFIAKHIGVFHGHHFGVVNKAYLLAQKGVLIFAEDSYYEARLAADLGITTLLFPIRGVPRLHANGSPHLIVTQAERLNEPGITDEVWEKICRGFWQEFVATATAM